MSHDDLTALRREVEEVHREIRDVAEDNERLRDALVWYLDDDRRAVDAGILETIAMRPAFEALGGEASRFCSAHRGPDRKCPQCYPPILPPAPGRRGGR